MSYLVDALKKAERERRARDAGDLHRATHMHGARPGGGMGRWIVAGLVAINVALVVYIWRPQAIPLAERAEPTPTATTASASAEPRATPSARQPAAVPASNTPATRPEPDPPEIRIVRRTVPPPAEPTQSAEPAPEKESRPDANGKVVYSDTRLSADATPPSVAEDTPPAVTNPTAANQPRTAIAAPEPDMDRLQTQSEINAPGVTINGQLYSTVPGRSFILVDGRRYHEGERLAAGPAVEQIEPSGAILRYQGQRYRVAGPG